MKILLSLLSLSLIVACNGANNESGKSKNKNLVLPVCSEYEYEDCSPQLEEAQYTSFSKITVPVFIDQRINRNGFRRVEFLENISDDGLGVDSIPCNLKVYNGEVIRVRNNGDKIEVRSNGELIVFNRLTSAHRNNHSNGIYGKWGNTKTNRRQKIMTVLNIQNDHSVSISKKCIIR